MRRGVRLRRAAEFRKMTVVCWGLNRGLDLLDMLFNLPAQTQIRDRSPNYTSLHVATGSELVPLDALLRGRPRVKAPVAYNGGLNAGCQASRPVTARRNRRASVTSSILFHPRKKNICQSSVKDFLLTPRALSIGHKRARMEVRSCCAPPRAALEVSVRGSR